MARVLFTGGKQLFQVDMYSIIMPVMLLRKLKLNLREVSGSINQNLS
uniref:Uncharacterized protein n=1 Tax=Heterorhabditis bacteriophora TaxID=37862 RepID=A0A1I7X484_HETBA